MSESTTPDHAPDDAQGEVLSTEEYGSLTVEDDPDGTIDGAELAGTAAESDHDLPDSGTQPNVG